MSHRRRHPDAWSDIQAGDIVYFDTKSLNCPSMGYVHKVAVRDDGKRVLTLYPSTRVVEHVSYRPRISERNLTLPMTEPGGPLAWSDGLGSLREDWSVQATFDFSGKAPTVFKIEALTLAHLRMFARWNTLRGKDLTDNTPLILEAWGEQPEGMFSERRAWRKFDPETRRAVTIPVADVSCSDIEPMGPANEQAFAGLDASSYATEKVNDILGWIWDRRYQLDDPGQMARRH